MTFLGLLDTVNCSAFQSIIANATSEDVSSALNKDRLSFNDYLVLLSPVAAERLEELAQKAQFLTLKQFGKAILLYVPLYLSNECDNQCVYCGFNQAVTGKRVSLSVSEVEEEADLLYQKGFRHILLVSGEKRDKISLSYLKEVILKLHGKFDSVALEIFPLEESEYKELFAVGADSLTIYQEVYNPEIYKKMHPKGPKSDFAFRLLTPERAGRAGFYRLNIGTLLGLAPWEGEAALVGLHASYLKKTFWQAQVSVSFPRLKDSGAGFKPLDPVSDRQLVQIVCALRLFQPSLGLVLSTREPKELRDHLIPLGITQMSAESKTSPGAYSGRVGEGKQFEVADKRSLQEVTAALSSQGYDPVLKDWDRQYIT